MYDKSLPPHSYQIVHHDLASDVLIMRLKDEKVAYAKTTQAQRFRDLVSGETAFVASIRSVQSISFFRV